jgi:SPP1 gp7 family putative phage head morphogenesis protein
VILGQNPRVIAAQIRTALGGNLARALTIARTEMLGVYREAARRTYSANPIVTGWVWWSALDRRTCPVCWAQHGTFHEPSEPFGGHPSCRCSMLPSTKGWKELGFDVPETRVDVKPGEEVFAGLDADTQRFILGPKKFEAYARGDITLPDLVKETHSPRWGIGHAERSLDDALGVRA